MKVRIVYAQKSKDGKSLRVGFRPAEGEGEVQFVTVDGNLDLQKGQVVEWDGKNFSLGREEKTPKERNGERINASVALKAAVDLYGHLLVANAVDVEKPTEVVTKMAEELLKWLEERSSA
jgi:predicted transcriptional regulator